MKKIGFIGLGLMGAPMAGHLMDAGYELSVYNRTKSKADALVARGARYCDTPGACAKGQDVVITIVGYPADVEELYLGADGILDNLAPGAYTADMTTSSPTLAARIYEEAKNRGIYALDAPVTGGDMGARAGTLNILVGGDEDAFNAMRPVFAAMGSNIIYEGAAGAGQKTKAANQIAIAGALAGACEAFAYAKTMGLDVEKVFASISGGAAASFQMSHMVRMALDGNFDPGFMLKHFIKDMNIGVETGSARGLTLPVLRQVLEEARTLEDKGLGAEGTQSLLKYYEK
ncbi:NADP oxidoreductase coenzyme F420-dependent [Selenomonas sp. FOBRC9]|uniref:NAD(P)-dependent oxidoreductase n=1 Tax=Selenomonas sp. FOBRC9 TaxID=936573 RepID=UPI00027A4E5A|nr:NAD(P)-dependent oxidoreductase [Selenomonas sp. FOBRC9]EJP33732.1 NADP oxidoreductase coenzyme F420-dependent [Selenomonas sp. FOBRC9]